MSRHYQKYRGSIILLYRFVELLLWVAIFVVLFTLIARGEGGKWSGLEIIDYSPMFDLAGYRYARITITNPSQLDKIVEPRYFIATLADHEGTRVEGMGNWSSFRIQGGEVREITVYFGRQIWPIANIETK